MKKIETAYTCDIPQEYHPGHSGDLETGVPFSIGDQHYEIDLCEGHKQAMRQNIAVFLDLARQVAAPLPAVRHKRRTTAHRRRTAEIREWAKGQGIEMSDRGRIPASVIQKWEARSLVAVK